MGEVKETLVNSIMFHVSPMYYTDVHHKHITHTKIHANVLVKLLATSKLCR